MLACEKEECEASLKAEHEQVLTPPGSSPHWKKFLRFQCARAWGHTRSQHTQQKLPGKLQRDASSRAQRERGECLQSALFVWSSVWLNIPKPTTRKKTYPKFLFRVIWEQKENRIRCVLSPCPSPQSLPLTEHLQDGNLLGCLSSTQVDKHIDRRVNAICCFREKWGPQTKWNCWSQARGNAPFPLQQTRACTSTHTCTPLPSNF